MALWRYESRLKRDFKKVFDGDSGRHVLVHLYQVLCGNRTTVSPTYDPIEMAINEGRRQAWLVILANLAEEDQDMRRYLEEHIAERRREEEANQ